MELNSINSRRAALRHYFVEVLRDLAARGVIRISRGDKLEDVLSRELGRVAAEMRADFAAVGVEIGAGLLGGLEKMLFRKMSEFAGKIGEAVRGGGK